MAQLKELSTAGVMQTDEAVACTEAVTIGAWSGYRGVTLNTLNPNVAEAGSTTYGAWTATLKGGTKLVVMLAGYPSDANSIAIDPRNGLVYSTTSRTVYLRYLAHAPVIFAPTVANVPTGMNVGEPGAGDKTVRINSATAGRMLDISMASGHAQFASRGGGYASIWSDSNAVWLASAGGKDMFFDAGAIFYFRDCDASNVTRMSLDSATGILTVTGAIVVNGVKHWGKLSTAPATPGEGDEYYNTANHKKYVYDGSAWQACW